MNWHLANLLFLYFRNTEKWCRIFNDKWLNAVNAYGDLNDITQILGITEEDGPLDILVKK